MALFKNKYRIEPNRLQIWDYSSPGSYYITICVEGRDNIFGRIENNMIHLSDSGKIVSDYYNEVPSYHKRIILDEWVIMPNHIHCIITLGDYDFDNGVSDICVDEIHVDEIHEFHLHQFYRKYRKTINPTTEIIKQYRKLRRKMLIIKILGKFKMQTSKQINILNNSIGKKNWQRDFYDHIIRGEEDYKRISKYIKDNPSKWRDDKFHNQ